MALTKAEIKQYVQGLVLDDRGWNWNQWNDECHRLSVHVKYDQQLINLEIHYEKKLKALYQLYQDYYDHFKYGVSESFITTTSEDIIADLKDIKNKFTRIAKKWNTVKAEIRGRELGFFVRTPVGTIYYIDLDSGNDSDDGLSTGNAWLTLAKYTTTTVRSAGDIVYVRANTDEAMTSSNLVFDEDGDINNLIEIIGCDSVVNDPWSDSSDVKPILTFSDNAYYVTAQGDKYWKIARLIIKESASNSGNIKIHAVADGWRFVDCEFTDNSHSAGKGVHIYDRCSFVLFDGCVFKDNRSSGLYILEGGVVYVKNCTFDGGSTTTDMGLYAVRSAYVECIDCNFGQITAHDVDDIAAKWGSLVKLRNCSLGTAGISVGNLGTVIFEEDADGVYGAGLITDYAGAVTKQATPKTGDADFSLKMEPDSNCGTDNPLTLNGNGLIDSPFVIQGTASSQVTITIKFQAESAWTVYPTNSELYIEASYYDSGSDAGRSTIASTQTISASGSWVDFTVTMTPQRDGVIYVNVYLKKYESGKSITVNGEAVTS